MSFKSKYIIVDNGSWDIPIVFGDIMPHNTLAKGVRGTVVGAGFCYITDEGKYFCYGRSESLNIDSRGEVDSKFLNKYLGVDKEY
jgi:hypothetical protein